MLAAIGRGAAQAAASTDVGKLLDTAKRGAAGVSGAAKGTAKGGGETLKKLFGK